MKLRFELVLDTENDSATEGPAWAKLLKERLDSNLFAADVSSVTFKGKKAEGSDDFMGTELEKDVIRAATEWFEHVEVDKDFVAADDVPQSVLLCLYQAVMILGAVQGGF